MGIESQRRAQDRARKHDSTTGQTGDSIRTGRQRRQGAPDVCHLRKEFAEMLGSESAETFR